MFTGVVNTDNSEQVGGNVSVLQQDGSGNLKVATASSTDNQRVSAQAGDFADGALVTMGAKADSAVTNPALSASEIAILKGLLTFLSSLNSDFPGALALADGMSNPTTTQVGSMLMGWNGSNWGRVLNAQYSATGNSNDNGVVTKADLLIWNGSSWDFLSKGQATGANSLPVILASDQGLILAQGSTTSGQSGPLLQGAVTTSSPSYTNGQTSPFSLTPSGGLRAAQSGTWTAQPGNTPNTTPWLVNPSNNNASVPTGAGNTVIKNAAGGIGNIVVTTTGSGAGNVIIYDNASTNSGTPLFAFPATVTAGTTYLFWGWAKLGITAANVLNGPVFTVYYS